MKSTRTDCDRMNHNQQHEFENYLACFDFKFQDQLKSDTDEGHHTFKVESRFLRY